MSAERGLSSSRARHATRLPAAASGFFTFGGRVQHSVRAAQRATGEGLRAAVHRSKALSRAGVLERLFTAAFRGLVYPQIWEDPVVDLEALRLRPTDRVLTIASGGCNALSYLTADPAEIVAIDLNGAHIALGRLKLCALQHLPDYEFVPPLLRRRGLARQCRRLRQSAARPHRPGQPRLLGRAALPTAPPHRSLRAQRLPLRAAWPLSHRRPRAGAAARRQSPGDARQRARSTSSARCSTAISRRCSTSRRCAG